MIMSAPTRKLLLTTHVLSSIGWFGALLVFGAHSIASLVSGDPNIVRSVCIAMALTAWFVILPLSLASLMTGVVQALGTAWGLLRHYWVVAKLLLTAFATAILLLKLAPISDLAAAAGQASFSSASIIPLEEVAARAFGRRPDRAALDLRPGDLQACRTNAARELRR